MVKRLRVTGTKEWASVNFNILKSRCPNGCAYCYGRANALRYKRISSAAEWTHGNMRDFINWDKVSKGWSKRNGTIMFPTSHDIFPEIIEECVHVLKKMLKVGNRVLIVSKPYLECIERICDDLEGYKGRILFRFTIGSLDDQVLKFWEPSAPGFDERFGSLKYAYEHGFATSVSCEPFLDSTMRDLFHKLKPYVTDSIWIGLMNHMETRIDRTGWTEDDYNYWHIVKAYQVRGEIEELYEDLKDEPLVRWKDSIKKMLGLAIPSEVGLDI